MGNAAPQPKLNYRTELFFMKSNMKQLKIGECWNAIITLERVSWTKGNSKRRCHYWISLINCSVLVSSLANARSNLCIF